MKKNKILELREVTEEKYNQIKTAMINNTTVYYEQKRYKVQALREYYSKLLGGTVNQAELIEETPLNSENVLIVSLCDVEV